MRETLQVGGDVRPGTSTRARFELLAGALRDRGARRGPIAIESTTRFFIVDGVRAGRCPALDTSSPATPLVRACRLIKSPAELALHAGRQRRHDRGLSATPTPRVQRRHDRRATSAT